MANQETMAMLNSSDPAERRVALDRLLKSEDPDDRLKAMDELGSSLAPNPRKIKLLLEGTRDSDARVVAAALKGLKSIGACNKETQERAQELATGNNPAEVRRAAKELLMEIHEHLMRKREELSSPHKCVREWARETLEEANWPTTPLAREAAERLEKKIVGANKVRQ